MGFLAAILLLELWPIVTLVRWRRAATRGGSSWTPDVWQAATVRIISYVEAALVIAMVTAAVMMARGYGAVGPR
jgi:putative membrane protein